MDAIQRLRERVHSLLVRGLASERVAGVLGIEGVSDVWGGAQPLDRPAWYLWLRGAPGGYRLGLEDAVSEGGTAAGRFSLRYYPSASEPAFARFAVEERAFVERGFLDGTGTPRLEVAHEIPDDLFGVGMLEYQLGDGDRAEVAFASMDRLRVRYEEDAGLRYAPLGVEIAHRRGDLARDVPGWSLGVKVFRCLAGLHAHHCRRAPSRVSVERHPGTDFVRRGGRFECVASADATLGEVAAQFGGTGREIAAELDPLTLGLDDSWWGLADVPHAEAAGCGCGCGAPDVAFRHAAPPDAADPLRARRS